MPRRRRKSTGVSSANRSAADQLVGSDFISQFYEAIQGCPQRALQFYEESSKLARPDPHGAMDIVTTLRAIKEKILATNFSEFIIDIKTVDEQKSLNGGATVLVTGSLTGKDKVKKDFTQTFFLAPQEKGYYILNDIFRYVDMNGHQVGNVGMVDGTNKQLKSEKVPTRGFPVASNQSVAAGSKPSAQKVWRDFVLQFYGAMQHSPRRALQFYEESSKLARPDPHGAMNIVTTLRAIKEKILATNFREFSIDIKTVDEQESLNGGVTVLVTGSLTGKDRVKKDFTQSFFLAPQGKGYFVLSDIFRYVDMNGHQARNVGLVDGRSKQLQSEKVPIKGSSVGSNQSVAAGSKLSAQLAGDAFVSQFYSVLCQSPQFLYHFYKECSKLGRPEPHGAMGSVTTLKAINEKMQAMNFKDSSMVIKTMYVLESFHGGMTILVTGALTDKGTVKDFIQSFFLAPQEKGYFILNDIFRYVDDDDHQLQNISCIPATPVGTTPAHPSFPEDVQLAMAINASIQSAIAEGVPTDLNVPDFGSKHKTGDTKEGSKEGSSNNRSCVICFDAPAEGACIPCGHMVGCMSCLNGIKGKDWGCPVCRAKIDQVQRIYAV